MDGLPVILVVTLGVVSCSCDLSVMEVRVRPGDNVTLYCDCKRSFGVFIVWYRNCSHRNQPPLVLRTKPSNWAPENHDLKFEKNFSSDSYDLLILNATTSDEGLYYCGTEELKVENIQTITSKDIHRYGNIITSLTVRPDLDLNQMLQEDCVLYRNLLFSLSPAVSVLFTLIWSFLVYLLCQKRDDEKRRDSMRQTGQTQGGSMFYAALEILQTSQEPQKKRSSDFSTYSTVRYTSNVLDSCFLKV